MIRRPHVTVFQTWSEQAGHHYQAAAPDDIDLLGPVRASLEARTKTGERAATAATTSK